MSIIQAPLPSFFDTDGSPLEAGYIYFGVANQNPETNPVTVYWDAALTQPAAQPIRTTAGMPVRSGTPANLFASGAYSITVRNKNGILVYSMPDSSSFDAAGSLRTALADSTNVSNGDALVAVKRTVAGAIATTVHAYIEAQVYDVKADFGAKGDGTTDDTAAFSAAVAAIAADAKGGRLYVPRGTYKITSTISMDRSANSALGRVSIYGQDENSTLVTYTGAGACFSIKNNQAPAFEQSASYQVIENMTIVGTNAVGSSAITVDLAAFITFRNLNIQAFEYGMYCQDVDQSMWEKIKLRFNTNGIFFRKSPAPGTSSTQPNNITFVSCNISNNTLAGGNFVGGSCINFLGGSVENNGTSSGSGFGLKFIESCYEGGVGANLFGVYFESNNGVADLILENASSVISNVATHNVIGCSFARGTSSWYATNNILATFGAPATYGLQVLNLNGCTFKSAGTYVPNAARPYIAFGGVAANKQNFFQVGCLYEDAVETPANMQWLNKMYFEASKTANQTITTGVATKWLIDTLIASYSWTPVFTAGAFTIPESGVYALSIFLVLSSSAAGSKQVTVKANGNVIGFGECNSPTNVASLSMTKKFAAGDSITIEFLQSTGGSIDIAGASGSFTHMNITKLID